MTDIIKRVWILSAFLWNPPGYTCVVFVVFLIWLEWAETLDFPCLSLGYIWLAKSKCQANYFDVVLKFMQRWGGGVRRFFLCHNKIYLIPTRLCNILMIPLHPLTPMGGQDRISPYRINTISSRRVVRIKKYINLGIISWFNTKFSELTW